MRLFPWLLLSATTLAACDDGAVVPPSPPSPASAPSSPDSPRLHWSEPVRTPGRTDFLPHPSSPCASASRNAVWCATFPLAWQALGEVLGGAPDPGPPCPPTLVAALRDHPFPASSLDPSACLVAAGRLKDGILESIGAEGRRRFGVSFPRPEATTADPEAVFAYAFLRKDLPFAHPFEPWEGGLAFRGAGQPVPAFGVNPGSENIHRDEILGQVRVLFGNGRGTGDGEFGLSIVTRGGDRLVLARIAAGPTLERMWERVARRAAEDTPRGVGTDTILAVPKIHFDLEHFFEELQGAPLRNPGFETAGILEARQRILFRMDEMGLRLESDSSIGLGEEEPDLAPESFVFDRPFLLALREEGAAEPYLLLWVANTDLMPVDE